MSRESRMELIRRRGRNEHQTLIKKFLDQNKEPLRRLKAFKTVLEKTKQEEVKEFFNTNASVIFYVVYTSFTNCEDAIQNQKVKKMTDAVRDLTELVLPTLEEIMITLPERVRMLWQSNSICLIIRKLLHPHNHLSLHRCGIRLLVIWLQCLQGNGSSAFLELFASAVPGFPQAKTQPVQPDDFSKQNEDTKQDGCTSPLSSSKTMFEFKLSQQYGAYLPMSMPSPADPPDAIGVSSIKPLSPVDSEGGSVTMELMRYLLECLTTQVGRLKWDAYSDHMRGFSFLFFVYKLLYLSVLYKGHTGAGLYSLSPAPVLARAQREATFDDTNNTGEGSAIMSTTLPPSVLKKQLVLDEPSCDIRQASFQPSGEYGEVPKSFDASQIAGEQLRSSHSPLADGEPLKTQDNFNPQYPVVYQLAALIEGTSDLSNPVCQRVKQLVLEFVVQWLMTDTSPSNASTHVTGPQANINGVGLMKRMLMSSRDNVNLLLEILKQGFVDTSFSNDNVLRNLISVYNKWMTTHERPIFMMSPAAVGEESGSKVNAVPAQLQLEDAMDTIDVQPWEALSSWGVPYECDVGAGLQPSLHMCVDHTSKMFFTRAKDSKALSVQVDLCKKIIRLYQDIVTAWLPDQDTWSYILAVLLHLVQELLSVPHDKKSKGLGDDQSTLGDDLASELLKTLLICFVRASLVVQISSELWDSLLYVMSSLTGRIEAIQQWKAVMESMTQILACSVYNLNLHSLPLNKAKEEKHRPRSKTVIPSEAAARNTPFSKLSFFRPPPAQGKVVRMEGQATSTPTQLRPTSIRPSGGLPSPLVGGPAKTRSAPAEGGSESLPQPQLSEPPVSAAAGATAHSSAMFDVLTGPESSVIVNPHVLCLSPDPRPSILDGAMDDVTGTLVVKNAGCQEVDPMTSLGAHFREPSTQDGQEQDSDSETKSNSSSAVLVVTKCPLRDSTPPPTNHPQTVPSPPLTNHQRDLSPQREPLPTSDDCTQSKAHTPSPSGEAVVRERSASSTSSSSFDNMASSAGERGGNFLSKASSEGNLLGSSGALLHQGKSMRPLLEVGSNTKHQQKQQNQRLPSIRRVVSTDVAHRSMEAITSVRDMQPGVDSFCMFLPEEEEAAQTSSGTAMRNCSLQLIRESSRFTQNPSWSQLLAAVVWQRMLKILGDINKIADPSLHVEAMTCLQSIWKSLFDIEANLGVSLDSQPPGELPKYTPPLLLIFPWVVKACSLPDAYMNGRRVAYELLCSLVIKHSHTPCSLSYLAHFYRLMHDGLCGGSVAVRNVSVKSGCKLFSHGCVGSTVLLSDSVSACAAILNSKLTESVPRMEALSMLGSALYLPELYPTICTLQNGVIETSSIKEQIVNTVLMAARQEPTRSLRCFAVHLLGILVFKELRSGQLFSRCDEAMDILFASLQFTDHSVALAAVDMLSLLREVFGDMMQLCPARVSRAIEALCAAAAVCMSNKEQHQTVTPILLCLRDWFMLLPSLKEETSELRPAIITTVFEVLHIATAGAPFQQSRSLSQRLAASCSFSCTLDPFTASHKSPQNSHKGDGHQEISVRIQMAARSVLTHLLNLFGHFPFGCGAAQLTSVVEEYHDSPSLNHLSELSSEVFDSPRVQFFALNKSSVITLVEIPTKLEGIPEDVVTSTYQTRVIVRDVSGKYCWDSAILYRGTKPYEHVENVLPLSEDTGAAKKFQLMSEGVHLFVPSPSPFHPTVDTSQPLSSKTNQGDMLHDLLKHIESTSPECVIYPGNISLTEPAPAETEYTKASENSVVTMLEKYNHHELSYAAEAFTASSMCSDRARPPEYLSGDTIQFQHCRVFLSHLGMLSWSKRNHLDLLKKDNQLILELRNLDQAHSRQTYKVAVLYVALGQEDKRSILRNTCGSREFEDFVAGLGWEVDLKTHAGYLGGLKKEFYTSCTLPYYATSSEEVLFHVATRMPSRKLDDDTKVRHLGNDEVHIVWSEHWRDYRRTIFKTQFADVVIVIYPQPSGLYRIQIDTKQQGVSPLGPLFDGALVDRSSLPILVRATAINILRAQKHPTMSYRRRYEERMKYIQTVIDQNLIKSSYEEFAQNVMHPLSCNDLPKAASVEPRAVTRPLVSTVELRATSRLVPSDGSPAPSQTDSKRSSVTKIGSLFSARRNGSSKGLSDRPESEALQLHRSTAPGENVCEPPSGPSGPPSGPSGPPGAILQRNHSVPENLFEVGTLGQSRHVRSPSSSSQSNLHKNMS